MLNNYYLIFRNIKMREKKNKQTAICNQEDAATLAAGSVAEYFKEKNWKIISFFPNSQCAQKAYPRQKVLSRSKSKKKTLKNTTK